MHYTLKDQQGSLTATICGNTVERLSYDAWGRRRDPNGFGYGNVTHTFDRGYTLHEHYDDFGLINMNGRMYDPVMSSFLSVDAFVDDPTSAQGFNRYAYCMHNPLRYTDPSGWRKQGREPTSGNYENWSMRYVQPVYEPRDFVSPLFLLNQSLYGQGGDTYPEGGISSYGFVSGTLTNSYGYFVTHNANGLYNYCFQSAMIDIIHNWQNNPSYSTDLEMYEAGIRDLSIGVINGQVGGEDGYRNSYYTWTDFSGRVNEAEMKFEYVGGHENNYYSMSNYQLEAYYPTMICTRNFIGVLPYSDEPQCTSMQRANYKMRYSIIKNSSSITVKASSNHTPVLDGTVKAVAKATLLRNNEIINSQTLLYFGESMINESGFDFIGTAKFNITEQGIYTLIINGGWLVDFYPAGCIPPISIINGRPLNANLTIPIIIP